MRNRLVQTLGIMTCVIFILGCKQPNAPDCFQVAGDDAELEMTLSEFDKLELNDMIQYRLHQANEYKLKISGPENWINEVAYTLENKRLIIDDLNHCKLIRNKNRNIIIDIYAPIFQEVLNQSFLSVDVVDTLHQSKLKWINENAPSNCNILFNGDSCWIEMPKGTGDVELKGKSHFTSLYSNALGKLDAHQMRTAYLNCNHNSLQDINANAQQYLYVVFHNKGNLILNSTPFLMEIHNTDIGQLIIAD